MVEKLKSEAPAKTLSEVFKPLAIIEAVLRGKISPALYDRLVARRIEAQDYCEGLEDRLAEGCDCPDPDFSDYGSNLQRAEHLSDGLKQYCPETARRVADAIAGGRTSDLRMLLDD